MDPHWVAPSLSTLRAVLAAALIAAIATLAILVSGTGTARAAGTCTDSWKTAVNGKWSEAAKWSTGAVPTSSDEVCITVAGTYTVTAEGSLDVQSLTVEPASGSATLSLLGLGCTTSTYFNASANITTGTLGAIQLTNAKGSCSAGEDVNLTWGGTFANAGKITVAAGTAGGTRELYGALTNTGKISIGVSTSSDALIENKGSITVANEAILSSSSSTITNGTGGSVTDTGTGALEVRSGIFNQGGGAAGKVYVFDSTLNLLGAGAGTFALEGSDSLSGNVSAAQSMVVQGAGCVSGAYVTAAAGFTNAGSIELTNVEEACAESEPAQLEWPGTLTNTGKIISNFGVAGGSRTLDGNLTNSGAVNIDSDTSFDGSSALFDNKKTVTVADEATLSTTSGQTFTEASGGSVATASGGSLDFLDTTFNVDAGSLGSAPVLLEDSSTLNLAGSTAAGTFVFRGSDTMTGNVAAAQSVVLQSVGCVTGTNVTAAAGFTNAGSIELTNVEEVCAESEPAQLEWPGTLTNTGTLTSNFGSAGGTRTLDGSLTNSGAVNIDSDTSFDGSGAVFTNKNTVTVADEATLSTTSGQTFTEASGGIRGLVGLPGYDLQRGRRLSGFGTGAARRQLDVESERRHGRDVRVPWQ
jgi:fibronectin-binding autotransporter adhesin